MKKIHYFTDAIYTYTYTFNESDISTDRASNISFKYKEKK